MMQMPLIRFKDWHTTTITANNRKRRIQDWQAKCQDWYDQRNRRSALHRTNDRDAGQHIAEEHTAGISHENTGRVEVVIQEPESCTSQSSRQHGDQYDILL